MQLKPQDILVLLKLVSRGSEWTYRSLAQELNLSLGEVHNALDRATRARLYDVAGKRPLLKPLEEFLLHGVKYAFPAELGPLTRGMVTAYAAPPLNEVIVSSDDDNPPVWPDPHGLTRGYELAPLYSSVPAAAKRDTRLYELLALLDAIRAGRARERQLAAELLTQYLRNSNATT